MPTDPEISVVLRTYDRRDLVPRALHGALGQTLPSDRYEVVVVDDGSTDGTVEYLRAFADRIRLVETEHTGPITTLNTGLEAVRGDYYTLFDSDDVFFPTLLEELLDGLDASTADFAHCDYLEYYTETEESRHVSTGENLYNSLAAGLILPTATVREVGGYNADLAFPEYDLLAKLLDRGLTGVHVPEPLFVYYRHDGSLMADDDRAERGRAELRERYGSDLGIRSY